MTDFITIKGARQHNLKNIDLQLPKNKLVVFTGLSGSGKSSLAFDTLYAEGQRRYVESLSSYARQFLGLMDKPDVDSIEGLSPAIAIDQKTTSHNPRSTVGTITEIYDYLRLLYARVGRPHCPNCRQEISRQSLDQIVAQVYQAIITAAKQSSLVRFIILSPIIRDKKGEFLELFKNLRSQSIQRARIDNQVYSLSEDLTLIKTNRHTVEAIIERLTFSKTQTKDARELKQLKSRLSVAIETALKLSAGLVIAAQIHDSSLSFPEKPKTFTDRLFSEHFSCPHCNLSLPELEPRIFSFNSPHGACPVCTGLGSLRKIDPQKLIAPNLTLAEGAIIPFADHLPEIIIKLFSPYLQTVWKNLALPIQSKITSQISQYLERRYHQTNSDYLRQEFAKYMSKEVCSACRGSRLKPGSLSITIDKLNIFELTSLSIKDIHDFILNLMAVTTPLSSKEQEIAKLILKEISLRLKFLLSVGLEYLTLAREAGTLAGGEAQRIRLASQIGTGLTGVLYILDEPSIGLHQRDNQRLIRTLKNLRDLGNSIVVVEHDREIMLKSDYLVDFGPLAGKQGGQIVAFGTPKQVLTNPASLTAKYLTNKKKITVLPSPKQDQPRLLTLTGCNQHNLKNLTVSFPLNQFVVITGVSGSGKSTLIHDTLYHALRHHLGYEQAEIKDNYHSLTGYEFLNKVSLIDQSPIGRTPRSNPVTYTKAFDSIRQLFSLTKDARISGFSPGRFSFNVKGGRCEACQGEGQVKIEMQFMPDVYITCEVCQGSRYNSQTLEVKYNHKNIAEVLQLTVAEALNFFPHHTPVFSKLTTLHQVGLGYIALGQPAPTLSGGEAQRVKLAKELSIKSQGRTLYLLDEPTTGLHFQDLNNLLSVLKQLVNQGNTVIIIEHNLDVIKNADWVIDLGPEGGDLGGQVVATGTPKRLSQVKKSFTGQYLHKIL
ncbi:excinuclease ABC subunit A [Candidatus Beckwithbacteria bacterium CG2_30_44_31]|uniref:UvrABC system protein A n=1 Tax=Candidatus Beckwithbacteria bacterium CG2_30_44_31 TaxID=1805035 RepID=A0A1J5AZH3_9BACT|nr:MAG: excinuclease ABC subunit A [Candidatus Beckwithbacteria bacterium CG2_30_44_31]